MILFCDTSALVKLYLREEATDDMLTLAKAASAVAVCRIAWAEAMAAFARRSRESAEDGAPLDVARENLRKHWPSYIVVEVTQAVVELAGEYADTFALRAYDSIQLAAANTLLTKGNEAVCFACFDGRLNKAARILGLELAAA